MEGPSRAILLDMGLYAPCTENSDLPLILPASMFREASAHSGSKADSLSHGGTGADDDAPTQAAQDAADVFLESGNVHGGDEDREGQQQGVGGDVKKGQHLSNNGGRHSVPAAASKHKKRLHFEGGVAFSKAMKEAACCLRIYQVLHPSLMARGRLFGGRPPRLKEHWVEVDPPYFDAPGGSLWDSHLHHQFLI
jgi:hypothetical protein